MVENVEKVLKRGEHLDLLVDRAEDLQYEVCLGGWPLSLAFDCFFSSPFFFRFLAAALLARRGAGPEARQCPCH